jgi:transcriptional regulator with XRE-family HTH domain
MALNRCVDIHFIQAKIDRRGIPLHKVGTALGISQKTLWNRLNGRFRFTADEVAALAELLDCKIEELFARSPYPLSLRRTLFQQR